jgi:hypothetical protein
MSALYTVSFVGLDAVPVISTHIALYVAVPRCRALQVEFERQIFKPVFHLIGYRLWV